MADVGGRGERGGILGLLDLIEEHTSAFEYDWRSRFSLPLRSVFNGEMTWREALSLTQQLLQDPSSHVYAATARWEHPMSREAFVMADVFDALAKAHFKNPKPYPRPTSQPRRSQRPRHSQATILAALAARGHGRNRLHGSRPRSNPKHPDWDPLDHLITLEEDRQKASD